MANQFQDDLLAQVNKLLKYHDTLGIKEYPRTRALERFMKKQEASSSSQPKISPQRIKATIQKTTGKKHLFDPGLSQKATLHDVRQEIGDCHRCSLHKTRTNIVFGYGSENARLMIIADAPGKEDDLNMTPLQGREGELLDRMLQAISLSRNEVYITTLVKCYPGDNARPDEDKIRTCLPFLFRQIEIICPQVICTMGSQSSQVLLHSSRSLFQLRGRFYNFNDLCTNKLADRILIMPSLYPGLLLENEELKKASWHDLQLIQKKLAEE